MATTMDSNEALYQLCVYGSYKETVDKLLKILRIALAVEEQKYKYYGFPEHGWMQLAREALNAAGHDVRSVERSLSR